MDGSLLVSRNIIPAEHLPNSQRPEPLAEAAPAHPPPPPPEDLLGNSDDGEGQHPDHNLGDLDANVQNTPNDLLHDLSLVLSMEDLTQVVDRWKRVQIDRVLWEDQLPPHERPLISLMVLNQRWPGVGIHPCPKCCGNFESNKYANISTHVLSEHNEVLRGCPLLETVSTLLDRFPYWIKTHDDSKSAVFCGEACPFPGCKTCSYTRRSLLSHLNQHHDLKILVSDFGFFWGSLLYNTSQNVSPSASTWFKKLYTFSCPVCHSFDSTSIAGMGGHYSSSPGHEDLRVEGSRRPRPDNIVLEPMLLSDTSDEFRQLVREALTEEDCANDRVRIEVAANDATIHNSRPPTPDPFPAPAVYENFQELSLRLLIKARRWCEKCEDEEDRGISFPRLKLKQRNRLSQPLKILFEPKIAPLISDMEAVLNAEGEDEYDARWIITEGIFSHIQSLIRKNIRTSLRIPFGHMNGNPRDRQTEYNRSSELSRGILSLNELAEIALKIVNLQSSDTDVIRTRNKVSNLERTALELLDKLDEDTAQKTFGGKDLEAFRSSYEHGENRIN